ncbi:hypothetical protein MTP99_008310 [Tenebrio molitor]|nr:hypothetical protein MTP99_008310 [Tenebrio molitor]
MGNQLNKFILLMWKNWTLLKRQPYNTAFEIFCPVLIFYILVAIRNIITAKQRDQQDYPPFDAADSWYSWYAEACHENHSLIGYSPESPFLEAVVNKACNASRAAAILSYNNKADLDAAVDNHTSFCLVIQFNDELSGAKDNNNLPPNLDITIRLLSERNNNKSEWFTNLLYPMFQTPGPRDPENGYGGDPGYFDRGFLFLQESITLGLMGNDSIDPSALDIKMQRFPYPRWLNDLFYTKEMVTLVTLMLMMSFIYNYINTIRAITTEKEKQLKESMKIMGLPGWLHWVAWFLRSFIILLLAIILIVIMVKLKGKKAPVFPHSDRTVLFIFFVLFACSTITFTFLISVFFTNANTAVAVGSLVFFLTYLPYSLQKQQSHELSAGAVLCSSLLANSGLCFGLLLILKFEAIEEGIHWDNLWNTTSPDENVTLGAILLMFILDTFLYLAIALYIEAVFPGDFGVPQPWYFPVSRDYWCSKPPTLDHEEFSRDKAEFFEKFTEDLPIGIQIQNLSKTFGANRAVKTLNLDMYEGHITVLLGHNGAGKTTTMSMITGMFPPSKGTAVVNGYDIRTSIQNVRDSMGLCLQHNVLFDGLTVAEHLYFFGKLKGLKNEEVKKEIDNYIKLLELQSKRNAKSSTLSGGMKRKLSVGIALCGKSKIVLLDEPTAGMDPSARRAIWNLLQKQKQGRTILLTTHFMDEADLLGDRIAIMTVGELQCCGSSFFLKRKYGAGYYLIMDLAPECQPENITNLLRRYIPHVQVQTQAGSEVIYQLSESDSHKFQKMLRRLEKNMNQLGILSYGVSLTTLEDVFMKVGADHDNEISKMYNQNNNENGIFNGSLKVTVEAPNDLTNNYLSGYPLIINQFIAMLLKKFFSTLRNWFLLILQIALPVVLLIITVLDARGYVPKSTFPSLKISLDPYNEPITVMSGIANQYYEKYRNNIGNDHQLLEVSDIATEMIRLTSESQANVKRHYIVGASFNERTATAWFNGDPYHSSPLSLSLVLNAFFKQKFDEKHSVTFINHPLPLSLDLHLDSLQFNPMVLQIAIMLGFGMAFVASFYILFYIRERVSKAKHLQFVSGVNVVVFWGTSFLCDMATYLLTMIAILITFAILQEDGFKTPDELGRLTLVLVYFGFFVLPFTYLASYLFSIPSSGFSRMMLLGAIAGTIGIIVMQILEIKDLDLLYVAHPLHWVLLFIPFYSVAKGAYDLGTIYSLRNVCLAQAPSLDRACEKTTKCCGLDDFYSMGSPGIGRNIIISFLMFIFLFGVLIFNEYGFFSYFMNKIVNYSKPPVQNITLESDVQEENNKIRTMSRYERSRNYALVLQNVTKYYKNFLAVNGLCLGVKPYECFGLLGMNGAGKTTTFKMMTGDEQISYGKVWVNGLDIKREQKKVQKLIGYCPQFDALLDDLTVRETLKIFALIRGVPYKECKSLGEHLAHEFDFFKHMDKKIKELSGGNKRKLSTAVALVGDPPIIYLDEPTTGMDPATKRFLWTALAKLRDSGKCIILTSHSMEECEALCTRLAIMVNGNFQCLGSTQRLKNKFATGYTLTIKVKKIADHVNLDQEIKAIDNFIQRKFPGAQLKEKYQELLSYQLTNNSIPWSRMFGILEKSKKELNIEDYSLGQCSLEQVFLSFTKHQQ